MRGTGKPNTSASTAKYAVFFTAVKNKWSFQTLRKLSNPTHVGGAKRFVCWNDMMTSRTIGYHENAPKMSSIGSAKSSVVRPPLRTQVTGERLARVRACA